MARRRNPDVGGFLLGALVGVGGTLAVQWAMNNAGGSSSSSETSSTTTTGTSGLPFGLGARRRVVGRLPAIVGLLPPV